MSYLVLARKYRPQTFAAIVGQEHVTQTLKNALQIGRLHHAFLFTGARGVGKTTAARILAKALSCEKPAADGEPCNACEACQEITSGQSVDVQEIDAASNNGVDSIRELREAIRYAPVRGKKKVYILDEVHMLSSGAWNALLKTLEEPPPHAVFVFATTDPHKLPATILSRVQRYDFRLVPTRRIAEHLTEILQQEQIVADPQALLLVAREAAGSVRDSLSLLDQVIASIPGQISEHAVADLLGVADRGLLLGLTQAILARDASAALQLIDGAFARGRDMSQLAQALLTGLRDLVVAQAVADPTALVDAAPSEIEALVALAKQTPPGLGELLFTRWAVVCDEASRSPLPRYVLEVGLVELCRIEPLQPFAQLLERLEGLENRLERGGARPAARTISAPHRPLPGKTATAVEPPVRPAPPAAPVIAPSRAAPPHDDDAPPADLNERSFAPSESAAPASSPMVAPPSAPVPASDPGAVASASGADEGDAEAETLSVAQFARLAQKIVDDDPRLSALAQARLTQSTDDRIELRVAGSFAADQLRDRMPLLLAGLRRRTGRDYQIDILDGDAAGQETLIEREQRLLDEDRQHRRKEAIEHPLRQRIDERFGGEWREPVVDDLERES